MRIRHKGLRRFALAGDYRGLPKPWAGKIKRILGVLETARGPEDLLTLPGGFRPHRLKGGRLAGHWSLRVTANWRIAFRFEGSETVDVDLIDYH